MGNILKWVRRLGVAVCVAASLGAQATDGDVRCPGDAAARRVLPSAGDAAARRVILSPGQVEVVIAPKANAAVRFAADEMTNFLSRVLGAAVPISTACSAFRRNAPTGEGDSAFRRNAPTGEERVSIVLGTNAWSAAAGVDVSALKRDGFVSGAKGGAVYIAGRDDPQFKPFDGGEYLKECATLYGVYDFLERCAGCRFYFPGELGEVVPRRTVLEIPDGLKATEPDWKVRHMPIRFGAWHEKLDAAGVTRIDRLFRYRLRYQTEVVPSSHGLAQSNFSVRFGKEHPEYFQLKKGKRTNEWKDNTAQYYHSMLCHTSGIWDEIYRDARSYFLGEGPEVRGMVRGRSRDRFRCAWSWNVSGGKYYDAAPQDGMSKCECPNCQAYYARAKDPKDWANELIWGNTARLANRLKADGFDCYVTQIAYNPYKNVPAIDLPSNILVKVVSNGPWARKGNMKENMDQIRAWHAKLGKRIWIWNNCGKHPCFNLNIRDFPSATPHAFGAYYKSITPYGFGACCDNSADRFLYSALDYCIFSRIAWDNRADPEAFIDEFYRGMFGAAADPMRRFFEIEERKWMTEAIGNAVDTPIGSVPVAPSAFKVWSEIFSQEDVSGFRALFAEAAAAVPADSLEGRRVALFKREFLDPVVKRTEIYAPGAVARELARRAAEKPVSVVRKFETVSLEMTNTVKSIAERRFRLKVEPGKTYRVSYVLTCEDAKLFPYKVSADHSLRLYGGVECAVQTGSSPKTALATQGSGIDGTHRSMLQAFEVTFPDPLPPKSKPQIILRLYNRTGRAVFEDLLVEEVKSSQEVVR